MTHHSPTLTRELDGTIRSAVDAIEADLKTIQSHIHDIEQEISVCVPGLRLFRSLTGEDHPVKKRFDELQIRAQNLRWMAQAEWPTGADAADAAYVLEFKNWRQPAADDDMIAGTGRPTGRRLGQLYDILEEVGRPMKARELTELLVKRGDLEAVENPRPAVAASLSRGVSEGYFWRPSRGLYAIRKPQKGIESE